MLLLAAALGIGAAGCGDDDGPAGGGDAGSGGDEDAGTGGDDDAGTGGDEDAGTGGDEDAGTGPTGTFCQEECTDDMDCEIGGSDMGFTCTDGRCTTDVEGCTNDNACVAQLSGWTEACATDSNCGALRRCVTVNEGDDRCASEPVAGACAVGEPAMFPSAEDGSDVTVCARTDAMCGEDGACFTPCTVNDDCAAFPGRPMCDTDTGRCVCSMDEHCTDVPGASVCNTDTGACECANNADCGDVDNADTCFDGACGCSEASICMGDTTFDGTTFVCE